MKNNNSLWVNDEITIKEKSEYKYAKEHIQKTDLDRRLTYDSNTSIVKAAYYGADLFLYIDTLERIGKPVIKQSEMYFNCLLVIHGARLLATDEGPLIEITHERFEDVEVFFIDGRLRIQGDRVITKGKDAGDSRVDLTFEFEDISCYFDDIYDYFG